MDHVHDIHQIQPVLTATRLDNTAQGCRFGNPGLPAFDLQLPGTGYDAQPQPHCG